MSANVQRPIFACRTGYGVKTISSWCGAFYNALWHSTVPSHTTKMQRRCSVVNALWVKHKLTWYRSGRVRLIVDELYWAASRCKSVFGSATLSAHRKFLDPLLTGVFSWHTFCSSTTTRNIHRNERETLHGIFVNKYLWRVYTWPWRGCVLHASVTGSWLYQYEWFNVFT